MFRNRVGTGPRLLLASIALPAVLTAAAAPPQQGAVFDVDSAGDEIDAVPGDGACRTASGVCTLRAAVMEANALEGPDTIRLPTGGPGTPTPSLTLAGTGDDASLTGDLDILDDLTITGGGMMISGAEASALGDRALHVHAGVTLNLSGVSFFYADAGTGQNGGGILNEGTVSMVETSLQSNRAGSGAGVTNLGQMSLVRSVVAFNSATGAGGGIRNDGTLTIDQSTIANNEVLAGPGGGIENRGVLILRNSTVSQNRATALAAALYNGSGASAIVNNGTVFLNAVPTGAPATGTGGIFNEAGGWVRISNTILSVNAFGAAYDEADCMGSIESAGYNLLGSLADCTLTGDLTGNLVGIDPRLEPMASVDPAGTWGYPPLADSQAIDAASPAPMGSSDTACETIDQRGVARPMGPRCDIGAYEVESAGPTATPVSTHTPVPSDTPTPTDTPTETPVPTVTPTPDTVFLFGDDFESGDLAAWSSARTDGGDLTVTGQAALGGAFGLQATIDDNRPIYVVDGSPAGETAYRARFAFDPNGSSMNGPRPAVLFAAGSESGRTAFLIEVRAAAPGYEVRAVAMQSGPRFATPWYSLGDEPHVFEIEWWAATGVRARDGGLHFVVDGHPAGGALDLRNGSWRVDLVRLGAVSLAGSRTRGTWYFDDVASWRPIGPGGS